MTRAAVELDARPAVGALLLLVREQQRLLDGGDDDVHRNLALPLQGAQCSHVDVHQTSSPTASASSPRVNSTCTLAPVIDV